MSEENSTPEVEEAAAVTEEAVASEETTEAPSNEVKLNGYYAFKVGMSSVYDEKGASIPVTVLKYKPWVVSQLKTLDKDGYEAVQIACSPKKAKNTLASERGHLKKAGFENGAQYVREIRQSVEGVEVGQRVLVDSFTKGDRVKISSKSKGRGFAGVMKRWDFGGGPASHGSRFHRRPGSIGNCTFPGRVMPGRKMPGHFGNEKITVPHVQIVEVLPEESVVLVKGPVPGARNSIVHLVKE